MKDEELMKYASSACFDYVDNIVQENPDHRWNEHDVEYAYRDGIITGAKWQAERLLSGRPLPEDTVLFNKGVEEGKRLAEEEQAELFTIVALDAAQRAKEQMMKEAVEVMVTTNLANRPVIYLDQLKGFQYGDKVRIIIVKEEK